MLTSDQLFARRRRRVRARIRRESAGKPRRSVFRSHRPICAQIIDAGRGVTLAAASSLEGEIRGARKGGSDITAAKAVGKAIAERALKAGVKNVVFDRGGYLYHGRVKALADAAREGGLSF